MNSFGAKTDYLTHITDRPLGTRRNGKLLIIHQAPPLRRGVHSVQGDNQIGGARVTIGGPLSAGNIAIREQTSIVWGRRKRDRTHGGGQHESQQI